MGDLYGTIKEIVFITSAHIPMIGRSCCTNYEESMKHSLGRVHPLWKGKHEFCDMVHHL